MTAKKRKWIRNVGKPYIRRSNGTERAAGLRDRIRLATYREAYGCKGFYVLVQRGFPSDVMTIGKSRLSIIRELAGCYSCGFNAWANRVKHFAR
jgi:hypothetical protein